MKKLYSKNHKEEKYPCSFGPIRAMNTNIVKDTFKILFLVVILFAISVNSSMAITNGTADGTYDFGNVGADNSGGAGYKTQGDKFIISNNFQGAEPVIYLNNKLANGNTTFGSVEWKAEGTTTMKAFTFENMVIGSFTASTIITQFEVILKNAFGATIAAHTFSGSQVIDNFDFSISSFSFSTAWPAGGYDNVAEIAINYTTANPTSNFEFRSITISNVTNTVVTNNAPTATAPSTPIVAEDDTNVALANDIQVSDTDGDDQTLTFTITGGKLTTGTSGLTFGGGGNGSSSFTAAGTLAAINTALDAATFTPTSNLNGTNAGTISFTTNDGTETSSAASVSFDISAVNDDPQISGLPSDINVTEDVTSNVDLSATTLSDVDAGGNSIVLTITAGTGTLVASSGGSVTIGGSDTGVLSLSGTLANINTYLNSASNIKYTGSLNVSGNDASSVSLTVNDGGNTGTGGGTDISLGTVNIDISDVNDEPTLTATATNPTFTEDGSAVFVFSNASASTIESDQSFSAFTATISNVNDGSNEVLTLDGSTIVLTHGTTGTTTTNSLTYSVSLSGTTATLSLSGGTLITSDFQVLINMIAYQNNSNTPNITDRVVTITSLTDSGINTGDNDNMADLSIVSTVELQATDDLSTVTTLAISDILFSTATANGSITDLGSPNPTQHGVCWNTSGTPTVADSKTEEGAITTTGAFVSDITGLISGITYYVRAYATNSAGTSYGSQVSFTTVNKPTITTTPELTVAYDKPYAYSIVATTEGELETIISAPTVPDWLTASADGQSQASVFGDIPEGVSISGVAGDDEGNIYAITSNGTTIYKIAPDGNTTLWRDDLISGQVYALHIANGYLYIPRYGNSSQSITRLPLNNSSATEETFASIAGGALSLTDKDGWIYAADWNSATISRINEDSKAVELLLDSSDGVPSSGPFGLTFDQDDNLYIATWTNKSILKYDGSSITTVLSGLPNNVSSIRQDKRGNFYLSMSSGGVRKYTQNFSSYEDVSLLTNDNIWSLSFTSSGALVYAKFGTNEVYRLQTGAILSGTPSKSDLGDHLVVIRATNDAGYVEQAFTITVIDTIKPSVSVFSPLDNATAVGLKPTLSVTFDEEISLASTGTLSLISDGSNLKTYDLFVVDDRNAFTQSTDNKTLSLDITESLPKNSLITIEISSDFVKDLSDNGNAEITVASGSWNFTTINTPSIATAAITIFNTTSATMGGEVTADGGSSVSERGVVYSVTATNSNPEIGGTGVTVNANGTGTGIFSKSITDLTAGATYSVKAYAINTAGTFYGSEVSFTTQAIPVVTASQTFNVNENAETNASVGTVLATDDDASTTFSSWTITAGNTNSVFAINESTGEITITDNTNLDFETTITYTLSVTVGDGVNTSSVQTVSVNVTDINDELPVITASQTFNIDEDAVNNASVGTVLATDADAGTTFSSWTITGGNSDAIFVINESTGEITIADNTNLDFETTTTYTLSLTVGDGENTSSVQTVSVNVTDINDELPVITASQTFNIDENAENNASVGIILATDDDADTTFNSWTITGGNSDAIFVINESTGAITIADNRNLDLETTITYTLSVTVGDGTNTSSIETVSVTINDINDELPVITASQTFNIDENAANNASVESVLATDDDANTTFSSWTITGGNSDAIFVINESTGAITIADNTNLDFETTTTYTLSVTVGDGVNTSSVQTVSVNVSDINDEIPVITASQTFNIDEDVVNSAIVGRVLATDDDAGTIFSSWTITAGNEDAIFVIHELTGKITIVDNTNLDFETTTNYTFSVTVGDGENTSSVQTVSINVTDINDELPVITASQTFNIDEDAANNASVGTVLATDADAGTIFSSWIITAGNTNSVFAVNESTGAITIADNTNLDFETTTTYTLSVTVGDGKNTSSVQTVSINVTDINDELPVITASQTFNIDEVAVNNASVGTVLATDDDAGTTFSSWTITAGNTNSVFAVNESTGAITIADNTNLDFETTTTYTLSVTVGDGENTSSVQTVSVNVTDINEAPTGIQLSTNTISENSVIGIEVGMLTASDVDANQSFTYTVAENENFGISGDKLVSKSVFDFETKDSYSVEITVTDKGDLSYTESFSITITDVNDGPSDIQLSANTIAENSAIGTEVGILSTNDVDTNQTFTYTIVENENFELVGDKLVSKAAFDFETLDSYSVEITVVDQNDLSYTESLTIQITDVNEAPVFVSEAITVGAEDMEYIYTIESIDVDGDAINVLAIEKPEWLSLVDNGDGTFMLSGTPTLGGSYHVVLEAQDSEFTVEQEFNIEVEVVTGIEPSFTETMVSIYPNPVANELHIDFSNFKGENLDIALYSLTGSLMFKETHQNIGEEVRINKSLQHLGAGMYLLVFDMDNVRKTYKIVKE
ncbi:cadherin domain-containing protein [Ancylomarina sp. 16SWW S1-10-2]|uniref:cadherin domain-containing protein n=1 Tax=Ancylomarina sp. 16SWW S1-10-2 TaxID=2499681 RepID=UPI0012AE875C|nr:cadherin domain-containing protein [Ancylomarina sp. 16SWW S1-10-2]MRT93835.1 T9SS type A sorting domain-containing protein [Ancylomarina sp. 16SWW S1-10-2]